MYKEKNTQQKGLLVKFEEHRFAARRRIALLIFHTNASKFSRESRFGSYRQMCRKMKALIVAFLARLFPLNAISKFYYPVSLVFKIHKYFRARIFRGSQFPLTFAVIFAVFVPQARWRQKP